MVDLQETFTFRIYLHFSASFDTISVMVINVPLIV